MIRPLRPALLRLFLCTLLMVPARAAAQASGAEREPPVRVDLAIGLATLDPIHAINAAPLFLTPGVQVRTTGRLFAFAEARLLVFALPFVSGSGDEHVEDEEGRSGFRDTGAMGGGGWFRAGLGVSLADVPLAPTLSVAAGSIGMGDAHPWVGASAGVRVRRRWRLEAELGYDKNWVEDAFWERDPTDPAAPWQLAYVHRTEDWYQTIQIGVRYGR
jgi:hypothetical protein